MQSIIQTERLVRRIGEVLGQPALEAQAAKLAQEYAEVGRAAARRLEQCALMIDAGDDMQALQLAETPPPLLDLITVLSFRQAGEWREFCQRRNLPTLEPFYDKHVRQLNAAYGKGLSSEHPYFRDYRRAVLKNEDLPALAILQVLAKLNPGDENVAQELRRLQEKVLRAHLDRLRQDLEAANEQAVLAQLDELENLGLAIPPSDLIGQQAQLVRCRSLLARAEEMRRRGAWTETEPLVEEVRTLANQNGLPLLPDDTARWSSLESWTQEQREATARQQDFRRALESLEYALQNVQQRSAEFSSASVSQLQNELSALRVRYEEAQRWGEVPSELGEIHEKQCALFQDRLEVRRARRNRVTFACVGLAVAGLLCIAFTLWNQWRAREFAAELKRFEQNRRVSEAQRLLEVMPARFKSRLAQPIIEVRQFIAREMALEQAAGDKLAAFSAAGGQEDGDLTKAERARRETLAALEQLAPEFQVALQSKFDAVAQHWQQRLRTLQPQHAELFSSQLAAVEKMAADAFGGATNPDAVRGALTGLTNAISELANLRDQPVPLPDALTERFARLTNQVAACRTTLAEWDRLAPAQPHSLEEHLDRLKRLARSPLASPVFKTCADELDRLGPSQSALLGELLLPGQPEAWNALTNLPANPPAFRPETPTESEKEAFLKMRDDPNMHDIYVYWLKANATRNDIPAESHAIFTRGLLTTNRAFQPNGLIYDAAKYPDALRFEQQLINTYDFPVIEKKGVTRESDAFARLGLHDLVDPNNGNYQKPALELLDRINQDTNCSSLFRAFVASHLFELTAQRPLEWGLQWAPSARRERLGLEELQAQNLQSGDWMVLNLTLARKDAFDQFFKTVRDLSLEKQARFFYRLSQRTVEKGFEFAGYADEQGALVLTRPAVAGLELWGWSQRARTATLLLERQDQRHSWKTIEQPLRLTPLFEFLGDRWLLLDQTAKMSDYNPRAETGILPPFYSATVPLAAASVK